MIEMQGVHFSYAGREVLRGIDLTICDGEFVVLIGPNGAGKSTFLKLFNGLNKPMQGVVTVDGLDTRKTRTSQLARRVGFLFQNPDRQLCKTTVREEILFGLRLCLQDEEEIARRLKDTLEAFALDPDCNPLTASRGERQRIALASLVALGPGLLILDEPTTGLDYRECMRTMHLVQALNREQGTTVLMVSHDMEIVQEFAGRVLILHNGQIVADGAPERVLRRADLLREAALLPPQILRLGLALGPGFDTANTHEEMAHIILERKKRQ
ncbi:MAG: energy-coupling factor ABC transporter ATP-binding protein [Candidatus Spyradocola sp.]|jgi:energy-coupling factor transport system ATP-binding protein